MCPLCRNRDREVKAELHDTAAVHVFGCPRCGTFEIDTSAVNAYRNHQSPGLDANRFLLSARARKATLEGRIERFEIKDFVAAERNEIPEPSLDDKIRLMLAWFQRRSTRFGEWLDTIPSRDYPVAFCRDGREWADLCDAVRDKGRVELDNTQNVRITLTGIEQLRARAAGTTPSMKESAVSSVPAHFVQYQADVDRFVKDAPFEDSVFVMMKFPGAKGMDPDIVKMLEAIFKVIREELSRYGLHARRADEKTYATGRQLWDNICVYALGSKYGLAVLEDRSGEEFNPNVALEYGFMRALGRDVILIKERAFKHIRADVLATIPKEFTIGTFLGLDEQSLRNAIEEWMIDLGRPARRRR